MIKAFGQSFNARFVLRTALVAFVLGAGAANAAAQSIALDPSHTDDKPSPLEHYMQFAHPIGTAKLDFKGPYKGYTFVHFLVRDISELGDTTWRDRVFLIDMNLSHDGTYLAPDTMKSFSDFVPFDFPLASGHLIRAKLAPTHSREELRVVDTSLAGSIGYGLLKTYITVFDFRKNELTFYPLYSNVNVGESDPRVIHLPMLDDAVLTYCHCPYPSVWIETKAPPLRPGRVQLAFQQPISQVFTSAIDPETQHELSKEVVTDPATGQKSKVGLNVAAFVIGGQNIAKRSPHRAVDELPPAFHDLSINIMGTLGTDVLRTFSGLIMDPSRNSIILVK